MSSSKILALLFFFIYFYLPRKRAKSKSLLLLWLKKKPQHIVTLVEIRTRFHCCFRLLFDKFTQQMPGCSLKTRRRKKEYWIALHKSWCKHFLQTITSVSLCVCALKKNLAFRQKMILHTNVYTHTQCRGKGGRRGGCWGGQSLFRANQIQWRQRQSRLPACQPPCYF